MKVIVQASAQAAAFLVAREIALSLRANPRLVLGLATGRTMELVYSRLARLHREEYLDFSTCRTFNLDEYVGLRASHKNSYHYYMQEHLFRHVNINLQNALLPDGMAADLEAECARYEQMISNCGGIDLQLLGIGRNGHLGFNEPPSTFDSRTRVVALSPITHEQNAPLFSSSRNMPLRAITMGLGTILECRRCLLLVTGADKAEIISQALEGPLTDSIPASVLQNHPDCTVILDKSAARRLKRIDHHHLDLEDKSLPHRAI